MAPEAIAAELARIAKHPYVAGGTRSEDDRTAAGAQADEATPLPPGGKGRARKTPIRGARLPSAEVAKESFKRILVLLRNHCGVDFSLYKSSTIQRRVRRRLVLNKHETLAEYATFLKGNAKELDALYSDVLISVTSFFRNPEAFDALKRKVFPKLLAQRDGADSMRIWVLGCSTGQEAYSLAMTFAEVAGEEARTTKLQIFSTDLNEALTAKARQ